MWFLIYRHTLLNKSDNENLFVCKAVIGENLENCNQGFMFEHKCPNLKFCAKFLIKSKKKKNWTGNWFQMTYFIEGIFMQKLLFTDIFAYFQ